jgi:hypothetical protein
LRRLEEPFDEKTQPGHSARKRRRHQFNSEEKKTHLVSDRVCLRGRQCAEIRREE